MTTEAKILQYMEKHGTITVREAAVDLLINSPTKALSNIRKLGYPLAYRWQKNSSTGARYKVYFMEETA